MIKLIRFDRFIVFFVLGIFIQLTNGEAQVDNTNIDQVEEPVVSDLGSRIKEILDQPGDNRQEVYQFLKALEDQYKDNLEYWGLRAGVFSSVGATGEHSLESLEHIKRIVPLRNPDPDLCMELIDVARMYFLRGDNRCIDLLLLADRIKPLDYMREQFLCAVLVLNNRESALTVRQQLRLERSLPITCALKRLFEDETRLDPTEFEKELTGGEVDTVITTALDELKQAAPSEVEAIATCLAFMLQMDLLSRFTSEEFVSMIRKFCESGDRSLFEVCDLYCKGYRPWYNEYTQAADSREIQSWSSEEFSNELESLRWYGFDAEVDRLLAIRPTQGE